MRSDALDRALAGTIAALSVAVGAALVLGMLNVLSSLVYLAVVVTVGLVSVAYLLRGGAVPKRVPAAWSIAGLLALLSGGMLVVLAFVPVLRGLPAGHPDTRNYHINNLVHWFQTHSIWDLPLQNPAFFTATHPGNGELAGIGLLFATGGDHLIYATNIVYGIIAVIATASITRSFDGRPDLGALAAIAVMGTPVVFGTQAHGLATDLAAVAGLAGGVAAILRARQEHDWRWIAVAGFALGFALGAKYTTLLLVPLVVLGAFFALKPKRDVLWLAPGLSLLAAPWFVRNWVSTGNPLFPQPISLFGVEIFPGAESPLLALKTTMLDHFIAGRTGPIRRFVDLGIDMWGPAILLGVLGVLGVAFRGRRQRDRVVLAVLVVVAGFVYLITPYTGAGEQGLAFLIASNLRYSIPAGVLGAGLAAAVLPNRIVSVLIALSFAFNAWWMVKGFGYRDDLDLVPLYTAGAVVVALAGVVVVTRIGQRRLPPGIPLFGAVAILAFAVCAGVVWRIDRVLHTTNLERVLERIDPDEITVVGVNEMRAVWGRDLDANVRGVTGGGAIGERPLGKAWLDRETTSSGSDALVVQDATPAVPEGWVAPDEWELVARTETADVYVRDR